MQGRMIVVVGNVFTKLGKFIPFSDFLPKQWEDIKIGSFR